MEDKNREDSEYWSDAWVRHIERYLSAPPRCGVWLNYYFPGRVRSFLECAGGTCRDSRYLFELGRDSTGSDFDGKTLSYLRQKFGESNFCLKEENAFALSFENNSIDVIFHNGFWIYFDDEKLFQLIKEQVRVSKKYAVILVHNKSNEGLVARFNELALKDDIYKIRFFDIETLNLILKSSEIKFKNVKYEKFGGPVDYFYAIERRIKFLSPVVRWLVPRLYKFQSWDKVERIAMIIELDK